MKWFGNIFRRKEKQELQPLRIDGVADAPVTAEPDDAEIAAQALLEAMSKSDDKSQKAKLRTKNTKLKDKTQKSKTKGQRKKIEDRQQPETHDSAFYHQLADKIRQAHEAARLRTMRFISFCEQELQKKDIPLTGESSLTFLETELFKRLDTIEREGGELKRRWQHCLAEVIVRQENAVKKMDSTEMTD